MPPNCPPRNARKRKAIEDLRTLGRNPKGNATEGEMLVDEPQPEGEAQELLRAAGGNSPGQKLHEDIPKDKLQTYAWDVSPPDPLLKPPECNYTYITARGTLRDPHRYDHAKRVQTKVPHPNWLNTSGMESLVPVFASTMPTCLMTNTCLSPGSVASGRIWNIFIIIQMR
jgi:hypothetical protein